MTGVVSLILDALVIVLLGGTIFYAVRLSRSIKAFQDSRKDMEKLLSDLSAHIGKAEEAIEGLRSNARQAGRDLQVQINDARGLSEELQIMSESGNSLAGRLEKLAEGASGASSSRRASLSGSSALSAGSEQQSRRSSLKNRDTSLSGGSASSSGGVKDPLSAFAIRDPEFDDDLDAEMDEFGLMQGDYEDESDSHLGSQAERDLYEALRSRKKTEAGGV